MAEDTLLPFSVGLMLAALAGAVGFGIALGRFGAKQTAQTDAIAGLRTAIASMDAASRKEAQQLGQRWHDAQAQLADHELRLALVERDLGIPQRLREDRTPVATMRRPRVDTGPHETPER